jgi:hypothetical protein
MVFKDEVVCKGCGKKAELEHEFSDETLSAFGERQVALIRKQGIERMGELCTTCDPRPMLKATYELDQHE